MPYEITQCYLPPCHPAEVTFPPLPQPKLVLDLATPVVLTCCKGDGQSQWKTPIFGPSQLGNPLTDFDKI